MFRINSMARAPEDPLALETKSKHPFGEVSNEAMMGTGLDLILLWIRRVSFERFCDMSDFSAGESTSPFLLCLYSAYEACKWREPRPTTVPSCHVSVKASSEVFSSPEVNTLPGRSHGIPVKSGGKSSDIAIGGIREIACSMASKCSMRYCCRALFCLYLIGSQGWGAQHQDNRKE